jgi:hypothetical protein
MHAGGADDAAGASYGDHGEAAFDDVIGQQNQAKRRPAEEPALAFSGVIESVTSLPNSSGKMWSYTPTNLAFFWAKGFFGRRRNFANL